MYTHIHSRVKQPPLHVEPLRRSLRLQIHPVHIDVSQVINSSCCSDEVEVLNTLASCTIYIYIYISYHIIIIIISSIHIISSIQDLEQNLILILCHNMLNCFYSIILWRNNVAELKLQIFKHQILHMYNYVNFFVGPTN